MVKFFSKIRHQLWNQSQFSRYLLYAIGEILLVVIGILIALQVNNWNENRKRKADEKELLIYALENIESDSISLDFILSKTDRMLDVHRNLILLSENKLTSQAVGNLDLIRLSEPSVLITKKHNPNLPNEIKDKELRKVLLDHYLAIDWLEFVIRNHNEVIEGTIRPYLAEKKLLNYGHQLETARSNYKLINVERFFEEFKNEDLRQELFESGVKLRILRNQAKTTSEKNENLKKVITTYLNRK